MKATIRIPTNDYAFIEIESEFEDEDEVLATHDRLTNKAKEQGGYNMLEWAKIRNNYLLTAKMDPDITAGLSKAQRYWVNETKNGFKQIKHGESNNN